MFNRKWLILLLLSIFLLGDGQARKRFGSVQTKSRKHNDYDYHRYSVGNSPDFDSSSYQSNWNRIGTGNSPIWGHQQNEGFQQPSRFATAMQYADYANTAIELPSNLFGLTQNAIELFESKENDNLKGQNPQAKIIKWNSSCVDASFRTRKKPNTAHTLALTDHCAQTGDDISHHQSWVYHGSQLRLAKLPYCMTCHAGEEDCRITTEKCNPKALTQKFVVKFWKPEQNSTTNATSFADSKVRFSIESLLFPKKCITMQNGNVLLNGCLFEPAQCPHYTSHFANEDPSRVPKRGSSIRWCSWTRSARRDYYYCARRIFKLDDCSGAAEQIFTF